MRIKNVFIILSLVTNIVVLLGVCIALIAFGSSRAVVYTWGPQTSGRGILLSIYVSILLMSFVLLILSIRNSSSITIEYMIMSLLIVLVAYKITTPFTAGISNPCVIVNLFIAALHAITLGLIWSTLPVPFLK